jgi:serine/alanine adding enzyme
VSDTQAIGGPSSLSESRASAVVSPRDVDINTEISAHEWDSYVHHHSSAVAYHQYAWRGVFEEVFRHETVYLAARANERLVGVLPLVVFRSWLFGRFAVSLPFVNYGGVLANDEDSARALASRACELAHERRWKYIELRHFSQQFEEWPARRHKVTMWRDLPADAEALWASSDRKVRNLVRKTEKMGCVAESGGIELVADFYRVFARNMRDLGTPVYHRRWFEEILRVFAGTARVFIVRVAGQPVAASITIRWRDRVEVPWAGSLRAHNDKAPNMLLYWAMLRDAAASGARVFDFGRSTPNEGTFHFKKQWGAEPRPLVWEYVALSGPLPDFSPKNRKFNAAVTVWQHLPVPLTAAIGPNVVRNIP